MDRPAYLTNQLLIAMPAAGAGNPMKLVGALNPWNDGQFSNVAADAARHVAYMGSYDDQGVAVVDTRRPARPVLTDVLSTHIGVDTSDSLTTAAAPPATPSARAAPPPSAATTILRSAVPARARSRAARTTRWPAPAPSRSAAAMH